MSTQGTDDEILFEMYRGDDTSFACIVTTDDNVTPVDITDWTFTVTMKLGHTQPDNEAALSIAVPAPLTVNAVQGMFGFVLPNEQTTNLIPTNYYFDIQGNINGHITTIVTGRVKVKYDVTRSAS